MEHVYGVIIRSKFGHIEPGGYMSVYPTKERAVESAKYNLTIKDNSDSKEVVVVELPVVFREVRE